MSSARLIGGTRFARVPKMRRNSRAIQASFVGVIVLAAAACAPEPRMPNVYAQYALADPTSPEDVACWDRCVRWGKSDERKVCLSNCDGVVVTRTEEPCAMNDLRFCTYANVSPPAPSEQETTDDGSGAAVVGKIIELVFSAVTHSGADDDEADYATPRPRHEAPGHTERRRAPSEPSPERPEPRRDAASGQRRVADPQIYGDEGGNLGHEDRHRARPRD